MKGMTEFVEECPRVFYGQESGFPLPCLGEIADVYNDGPDISIEFRLRPETGTPGSGMFRGTREVVPDEHRHVPFALANVPGPCVWMVERNIDWREGQAKESVCAVKRCLDHPVELKIRLQLRLVEIVFPLSEPLGVVVPIPRLEIIVDAVSMH